MGEIQNRPKFWNALTKKLEIWSIVLGPSYTRTSGHCNLTLRIDTGDQRPLS